MRRIAMVVLAALGVAAGCSFVTDFPDIDPLQGGGAAGGGVTGGGGGVAGGGGATGGGGGAEGGGAGECLEVACQNCIAGAASCPNVSGAFVLQGEPSVPSPNADTRLYLTDGVAVGPNAARFIGTFAGATLESESGLLTAAGAPQSGFIVNQAGEALGGASACLDGGTPSGGEVFFNGLTMTGSGERAIVGAYEGGRMVFFPTTLACGTTSNGFSDGPETSADSFTPFIVWLTARNDSVDGAYEPAAAGPARGRDNGYLSDVTGVPAIDDTTIAAVGLARANPFTAMPTFHPEGNYYVITSNNPGSGQVVTLPFRECSSDGFLEFQGLLSSIAFGDPDEVWVGGTGCGVTEGYTEQPRSFLTRFTVDGNDDLVSPSTLEVGDDGNPMSISDIAVGTFNLFAAGTYSGQPMATLADGVTPVPTGFGGDGFVMSFARASFTNFANPVWFTQIVSESGPAAIEALVHDNGRLFVTGSLPDVGGIGDAQVCFTSEALQGGRAFVAELDPATGGLVWLQMDGFQVPQQTLEPEVFARGVAVVPQTGGLLAATRTHGQMLLGCDDDTTDDTNRTEVHVRWLDFP